jgi:type IV pilus assembly protein PilM
MANTVTLYIEDEEIKLLVANGRQITKWASQIMSQKHVRDGIILDTDAVADEIKNLFQITRIKENRVLVALSGVNSIFRIITLPAGVPKSILDEAITNEAQRVLPISTDQVYLNYRKISSTKDETYYYLAAHAKKSTDAIIKTVQAAGLKIESLDLAPLALARCVNEKKAVIVNSWLTYLDIVIMNERIPQVIRTISLPTDSPDIEAKLPLIGEEILRTISFYNSSFPGKSLDSFTPVLVCGDISASEENINVIQTTLENPVNRLTPPFKVNPEFPSDQYMVNLGMLMKGYVQGGGKEHYSIININAIPQAPRPPAFNIKRIFIPVAFFAALLVLCWEGAMLWNSLNTTSRLQSDYNLLQSRFDLMNSDINSMKNESALLDDKVKALELDIQDKSEVAAGIQQLLDEQVETNQEPVWYAETAAQMQRLLEIINASMAKVNIDLNIITGTMDSAINLTDISYAPGEAIASGVTANEESIFSFARYLKDCGQFIKTDITGISFNNSLYDFSIKLTW